MIKNFYPFIVLLMFTQKLFAVEFQIDISGGYGFPAARDIAPASFEMDTDSTFEFWEDGLVSYGNGIKLEIDATIFFNDYWGVMLGTGFSMLGGYRIESKAIGVKINSLIGTEINNWKFKANYLPITFGIKLRGGKSKITPYAYIAPGIIIPIGVKGKYIREFAGKDSTGKDTVLEYHEDITEKYYPGFVVSSGLGVLFKISNSIGVKFEFAPVYATALLKEQTFKYERNGKTYTETYIFIRNAKKLPDPKGGDVDDDFEIIYLNGAPFTSFSSIAAKIGIVFRF